MTGIGRYPGSWRVEHDKIPANLARLLYEEVRESAQKNASPVRIARQLSALHSISLDPGTIRHWMVGDRKPQMRNAFRPEPSAALSYVIGANIGDGCTLAKLGLVKLEVADRDFAEAFNANMAIIFSRAKPNKILVRYRDGRLPMYIVKYSSRQLVDILRQPMSKLLKLASAFPREFLRGFFDAEGHVDIAARKSFLFAVGAENSDRTLLSQIKFLLWRDFRIESRIYQKRRSGSMKVIRGKTFRMRRTCYTLLIMRFPSIKKFDSRIGFSIPRKTQKLKDAFAILERYGRKTSSTAWKKLYIKQNGEWVRVAFASDSGQRY